MNRSQVREWAKATKVSTNARLVYLLLVAHANDGQAFPSAAHLAHLTGLHRASVFRALSELEEAGDVIRDPRIGRSTVYFMPGIDNPNPSHSATGTSEVPVANEGGTRRISRGNPSHTATHKAFKELKETPNDATDLLGTGRVAWYTPPPDPPHWEPDPEQRARIVAELQARRRGERGG